MSTAKKKKPSASKPSAAQKIRHALDPDPPSPTDDTIPLPERKRAQVEQARPPPLLKLMSQREVCALIGVSAPTIWKWTRLGKFPKARVLNGGKLGYLAREIEAWILDQPLQTLKPPEEEVTRSK
jgi:predicted DNA-binding transcriptional regulator AlpA